MNIPKHVLLLQGPVGPFFDVLQQTLLKENFDCKRILFNAGDRLFCRKKEHAINIEGNLEDWHAWLEAFLNKNKPLVVILFGADRPIHSIARKVCKNMEIRVLCLEEGYFRPGFVTIEESGNNASSPIAGQMPDLEIERINDESVDPQVMRISKNSFFNKCWYGFSYYFWSELFSSKEQRKLFHKHLCLYDQAVSWLKNFFLWRIKKRQDECLYQKISNCEYHLVALQLDSDMQSRFQSNGWKKMDLINESIQSFANFSNSNSHLVFKVHPLERGHYNHVKMIQKVAQNFGIEDRVWTIQTGSIGQWIKTSKGMITINSTSGFSAIFHGVPLLLLGNAIYDHDLLVYKLRDKNDLDLFWNAKEKIDYHQRMHYLNWVKDMACHYGDFYTQTGKESISHKIIEKFL